MGKISAISWTDHTFNPWRGCVKVSEGCANCYAETMSHRNPAVLGEWGKDSTRAMGTEAYWKQPLAWDRAAARDGARRRVFCLSLGDVFEDRGDLINPRIKLFELINRTPNLDWLLLTKRPESIRPTIIRCLDAAMGTPLDGWLLGWLGIKPPPNVWLGVTAENQARAFERIPILLEVPAAVRFVSYEPALGPVDFSPLTPRLDWIICGGESGSKARPFDLAWARSTRDQCKAAGVAFFMKQLGAKPVEWDLCGFAPGSIPAAAIDSHLAMGGSAPDDTPHWMTTEDKAGADPSEWPDDLRVQQFPASRAEVAP